MKILLVANYIPDAQESMQRYVRMLSDALSAGGHEVKTIRPEPIVGGRLNAHFGLGKWLGYIDKFVFFPPRLSREAKWPDIVHVCDHSNSIYVRYLKGKCHVVTCHDVLAIRGALGEEVDCPASLTGKVFQHWILDGLRAARMVACDSDSTRNDLLNLIGSSASNRVCMVHVALNYPYGQLAPTESMDRLKNIRTDLCDAPFILHVGSNLRRKNREGVIEIFSAIKDRWGGYLVFAGQELSESLKDKIRALDIEIRVICIPKPDNDTLEALYNRAFVLLYPSKFEGYGWPIMEAQACGCPVLCSSDCGPFPEIVDGSAMMFPASDVNGFAEATLKLKDSSEREKWISKGFENMRRFSLEKMIAGYSGLYNEVLGGK